MQCSASNLSFLPGCSSILLGYSSLYSLVIVPYIPWLPFHLFPGYRSVFPPVTVPSFPQLLFFSPVTVPSFPWLLFHLFPGYCIFSLATVASFAWLLFHPFHCPLYSARLVEPHKQRPDGNSC